MSSLARPEGRGARRAIALRRANPCLTTAAIGREVGLSRQRVARVLAAAGLPTRAWRQRYACFRCGAVLPSRTKRALCRQCFEESRRVELVCEACDTHFFREESRVRMAAKQGYERYFCSMACRSRFIGGKYGFGAPGYRRPTQYDYDRVQALRDVEGWGARRVSEALGMTVRTVYKIWAKNRQRMEQFQQSSKKV